LRFLCHFIEYINLKRPLFIAFGFISLGLGIVGIIVPGLPTTPLVLLAAYFFSKSSKRFHQWLLDNRIFGKYIKDYQENPSIPLKTKIISQLMMWAMITYSTLYLIPSIYGQVSVILLGLVGSWYVLLHIPTRKKSTGK